MNTTRLLEDVLHDHVEAARYRFSDIEHRVDLEVTAYGGGAAFERLHVDYYKESALERLYDDCYKELDKINEHIKSIRDMKAKVAYYDISSDEKLGLYMALDDYILQIETLLDSLVNTLLPKVVTLRLRVARSIKGGGCVSDEEED